MVFPSGGELLRSPHQFSLYVPKINVKKIKFDISNQTNCGPLENQEIPNYVFWPNKNLPHSQWTVSKKHTEGTERTCWKTLSWNRGREKPVVSTWVIGRKNTSIQDDKGGNVSNNLQLMIQVPCWRTPIPICSYGQLRMLCEHIDRRPPQYPESSHTAARTYPLIKSYKKNFYYNGL